MAETEACLGYKNGCTCRACQWRECGNYAVGNALDPELEKEGIMELYISIWKLFFKFVFLRYCPETDSFRYISCFIQLGKRRWALNLIKEYDWKGLKFQIDLPLFHITNRMMVRVVSNRAIPVITGNILWKELKGR